MPGQKCSNGISPTEEPTKEGDIGRQGGYNGDIPLCGSNANSSSETARIETVRSFALWTVAHYTRRPDDRVNIASHGGLQVSIFVTAVE